MPPALCALLWWGWPAVRRIPAWKYCVYLAVVTPVIAAAEAFAARMAMGRLLWIEVFWAVYFIIAWRAAWAVWARTVGRLGERYRRWGRISRIRRAERTSSINPRQRRLATLTRAIAPARFCLVVFVFVPVLLGSLIHRIKIGNPPVPEGYSHMSIEDVAFVTEDGLTLSGWFVPEPNSDTTVLICHGLGANKRNFIDFVTLFHGRGYNSLIFDFRGHGDSDGHTVSFGLFETADVRAAVDWLKAHRPLRAKHVFGLGSSMGAMALLRTAADDERIEALVLDSCFVSAQTFAHQHLDRLPILGSVLSELTLAGMSLHAGASFWRLDGRPCLARLAPRPVFFIQGRDDFVVLPENMTVLYELTPGPKTRWLAPGQHSNIMTADSDAYQTRVLTFFDQARQRPVSSHQVTSRP